MITRKHLAITGMASLVAIEVAMGLASNVETMPPVLQTTALVAVLATGSVLQATLLKFMLRHRGVGNWRQYPTMGIQFTLFILIASWAHKGLGNTLFTDWPTWALWMAGLGLGLVTMFGPEVINEDYDAKPKAEDVPTVVVSKPVTAITGLSYTSRIDPPRVASEAHNIALEQAAGLAA